MWRLIEFFWLIIVVVNFILSFVLVCRQGPEMVKRIRAGQNAAVVFLMGVSYTCVCMIFSVIWGPVYTYIVGTALKKSRRC